MKKRNVLWVFILFFIVFSSFSWAQSSYREEVLNEHDLERLGQALSSSGHKGLIPLRGIIKFSLNDKLPTFYYLTCARSKGGLVKVEMVLENYPKKELTVNVIK
jgi:hypothetical protein